MAYVPTVVENEGSGRERSFDIYSRLLKDRIIIIGRPIDDVIANLVVAQLMYLAADDPEKEIQIYVNSPGGAVTAGLAIYDTMQYVRPRVSTICLGLAASMAAVLLGGGNKGMRYSLPNTRVLIHQPSAGFSGQATDIQIHAQEILRVRRRLDEILAQHTGKPIEVINHDSERDFFMSAAEAKDYGLIDEIIEGHGRVGTNGSGVSEPAARSVNGGPAGPTTDGGSAATRN